MKVSTLGLGHMSEVVFTLEALWVSALVAWSRVVAFLVLGSGRAQIVV